LKARFAALAFLALAGCERATQLPSAKAAPVLDPVDFFTGHTGGRGSVDVIFKQAVPLKVESIGVPDGNGGLVVDQRISEGDKAVHIRRWVIRPTRPGQFTGTLTDASGPVSVSVRGNTARIAYTRNGLDVEQRLVLSDDRRTIQNRMTIRTWGIRVAHIEERISRRR